MSILAPLFRLVPTFFLAQQVAPTDKTFWLPPGRSTLVSDVDPVFYFVYWVSVFFFVLIVGIMVYFCIKYRRRSEEEEAPVGVVTHNTPLEVTWTIIPLIIVIIMFYAGFKSYLAMAEPPGNSYTIDVQASQWHWNFTYPNGVSTDNELHVWKGQPFRLRMRSADVIHCFFAPDLRVKRDIVPGRINSLWFQPTEAMDQPAGIRCAEYCGKDHSNMLARLVVHDTRAEFEEWLKKADVIPEKYKSGAEKGKYLANKKGCFQCHTTTKDKLIGPGWLDASEKLKNGEMQPLANGPPVKITEDYLIESIKTPGAKIVAGFTDDMPPKNLKDDEILFLVDYIKSLAENAEKK